MGRQSWWVDLSGKVPPGHSQLVGNQNGADPVSRRKKKQEVCGVQDGEISLVSGALFQPLLTVVTGNFFVLLLFLHCEYAHISVKIREMILSGPSLQPFT